MTDLVEFLTARLDEGDAAAKALDFQRIEATEGLWDSKYLTLHKADGTVSHTSEMPADLADHVARHDPARVLADNAAKRAILALHKVNREVEGPPPFDPDPHIRYEEGRVTYWCGQCDHDRDYGYISGPDEGCETVRLLAAPYADHPDYRPEWRPDDQP